MGCADGCREWHDPLMFRDLPIRVRQPLIFGLVVLVGFTVTQWSSHPWVAVPTTAAIGLGVVVGYQALVRRTRR